MIKFVCSVMFKLSGWKQEMKIPDELRSFIFIGAPHTSNYDFVPAMAMAYFMKRNAKYVIKKEWLKFPLNLILGPTGAIGIDRKKIKTGGASTTDAMVQLFSDYPELVLMISPEGTRSPNETWKTGFYYIAQKANIPIVLGFADYTKKIAGTGPIIYPTNFEEDMKKIMEFYSSVRGHNPENFKIDSRFK